MAAWKPSSGPTTVKRTRGTVDGSQASVETDREFERSLEDYDEDLGQEGEILAGGGPAADEGYGGGSGDVGPSGPGSAVGGGPGGGGPGGAPGERVAGVAAGPANDRKVEGCEDTDVVARQLCEAATTERDPALREKLWQEYSDYKRIVAGK